MLVIEAIMEYEAGDLNEEDTIILFSELIRSGMAWKLQGHYGRQAMWYIENEIISAEGIVYDE